MIDIRWIGNAGPCAFRSATPKLKLRGSLTCSFFIFNVSPLGHYTWSVLKLLNRKGMQPQSNKSREKDQLRNKSCNGRILYTHDDLQIFSIPFDGLIRLIPMQSRFRLLKLQLETLSQTIESVYNKWSIRCLAYQILLFYNPTQMYTIMSFVEIEIFLSSDISSCGIIKIQSQRRTSTYCSFFFLTQNMCKFRGLWLSSQCFPSS